MSYFLRVTFSTFIFILIFSPSFSQVLCEGDCAISEGCGDLAVSGGLCAGSSTFFCEGGDTVCIENNSDPASFDEWVVWWSEGICDTFPNTILMATHVYNIEEDTCLTNSTLSLSQTIFIKNIRRCGPEPDDYSLNCVSTFIRVKVEPVAGFSKPNVVCVGEEACFINASCFNADPDSTFHVWSVDDIHVSETLDLCHTFPTTGSYELCLTTTNECGSNTSCQLISVIDVPIAQSSFLTITDPCLPTLVELYDESTGPASITWEVIEGTDYQFISSNSTSLPDTTIILESLDTFIIMHVAMNECGSDTSYLSISVFDSPDISISEVPPSCGGLLYEPDVTYQGTVDSVKWVVNNSTDTTCGFYPVIELEEADVYSIQAIAIGPCGSDVEIVTVTINASSEIEFLPIEDLCLNSDPFPLEIISEDTGEPISLNSGIFSCSNGAIINDSFFDPMLAGIGIHTLCFSTTNNLCPDSASINIEVQEGINVDVGEDTEELCINDNEFQLIFSPMGGEWFGNGITNSIEGIFDPAIAGGGTHILEYHLDTTCTVFKTKEITVIELPLLAPNDITICAADMEFDAAIESGINFSSADPNLSCFIDGVEGCFFNPDQLGIGTHELIFTYNTQGAVCSVSDTVSIEITALISVVAPSDTIVCQGEALTLTGTPLTCAEWMISPLIDNDGNVNTNGFLDAQTFTLFCNQGDICETSDEVTVTVVEGVSISNQEDWICETTNIFILPTGNPDDGNWSGDGLSIDTIDISTLDTGLYTYNYTVNYLPDICETTVFTLHVSPQPFSFFTHLEIGCKGEEVEFSNNSTGATHFFWDFGNDSISTEINPSVTYEATGDYTITLEAWTVHPFNGTILCIDTYIDTIHISEPPDNVTIGMTNLIGCSPLEINFPNVSVGESMNYQWCIPGLDTLGGENPGLIIFEQVEIDTTLYDVILKGWNDCDTLFDTIQVIVLPDPTANFGIEFDEPCSGGEVILNNLSLGAPESYLWTVTNLTLGTSPEIYTDFNPPPFTVFAPETEEAEVLIQLETSNGCGTSIFTDTVIVQPSPIIAQMNFLAEQVCVGDSFQLIDISTPGTDPSWEITQSNQDTFFFNGDTINFVPTSAGPFTVILYADGCGFDSDTLTFEAIPLPEVNLTFAPDIPCQDEEIHFEIISPNPLGNGVILYYGDGDSTNLQNSFHTYTDNGTFPLSIVAENFFGCQNLWEGTIDIAAKPMELTMTFIDSICVGEPLEFMAGGIDVQTWEWIFCDTCFRTGEVVNYTFDTFGLQTIQLVGQSTLGCSDTIDAPLFVRITPESIIDYEVINDCTPAEIVLNSLSLDANGIEWETSSGIINQDNITTALIVDEPGLLSIKLIATNDGICYDTAVITVPINNTPIINLSQDPNCTIEEGTAVSVETNQNNFISLTGENFESTGSYFPNVPAGNYLVEVLAPNGCTLEEEINVISGQELFIQLESDSFSISLGETIQLNVFANLLDVNYNWFSPENLDNPTIPNPIVQPFASTFYIIDVITSDGCSKIDTAYVQVNIDREKDIFIPNTFSPNQDGINDLFRIRSLNPALINIKSFSIFDRAGEKVYEAFNCEPETLECSWDGTFRGQKAELGLYIWMAELEFLDVEETIKIRGDVTLIR